MCSDCGLIFAKKKKSCICPQGTITNQCSVCGYVSAPSKSDVMMRGTFLTNNPIGPIIADNYRDHAENSSVNRFNHM